jgi:hypothetical protein
MKLRGAFDPKFQIILALVTMVPYSMLVWTLLPVEWARLDIRLAPLFLVLGMLFGLPIGSQRLIALRKILPQVKDQYYLSARSLLSQVREGENALTLQRVGWAVAFLIWFAISTQSKLFYASLASFILGSYLTGQVLPFIRIWLDIKKHPS